MDGIVGHDVGTRKKEPKLTGFGCSCLSKSKRWSWWGSRLGCWTGKVIKLLGFR